MENNDGFSTHDLFASGLCRLAVSINSNTLHEAIAWDIPAVSLGTLLWNSTNAAPPFPGIDKAEQTMCTHVSENEEIMAYMYHVIKNQWFLSDFHNPLIVRELIETAGRCEPWSVRKKHAFC